MQVKVRLFNSRILRTRNSKTEKLKIAKYMPVQQKIPVTEKIYTSNYIKEFTIVPKKMNTNLPLKELNNNDNRYARQYAYHRP